MDSTNKKGGIEKFKEYVKERNNGEIPCFFCGKPITGEPAVTGLYGRNVMVHHNCLHEYQTRHPYDIPWWGEYLRKLAKYDKYSSLYYKEFNKINKRKWRFIKDLWPFRKTLRR